MVRGLYAPSNLGDESTTFPHINFPYLTNSDPEAYPHLSLRPAGGSPNWGLALVTETGDGTNSFFADLVVSSTGEYTVASFSHSVSVVVESYGTAFTVNANSVKVLDITSNHPYYQTWFLNAVDYRSTANWYVHVKDIGINHVIMDYVNIGSTAITVQANELKLVWLLVRDNTRTS